MSLYCYLRLKRLWAACRQRSPRPADQDLRIANGFWYRRVRRAGWHFGETPSQTLARSRYGLA